MSTIRFLKVILLVAMFILLAHPSHGIGDTIPQETIPSIKLSLPWRTVVMVGDSILANRSPDEFDAVGIDPTTAPPLLTVRNVARRLYDSLDGEKANYYRYDSGRFGEIGTWKKATIDNYPAYWSDNFGRRLETSYTNQIGASVTFVAPAGKSSLLIRKTKVGGLASLAINGTLHQIDFRTENKNDNNETEIFAHIDFDLARETQATLTLITSGEMAYWGLEVYEGKPVRVLNLARGGHNLDELYGFFDADISPHLSTGALFLVQVPMMNIINDGWGDEHIRSSIRRYFLRLENENTYAILPNYRTRYTGNEWRRYSIALDELEKMSIPIIDMRNLSTIHNTVDGSHLNDAGANSYLTTIAKELSKINQVYFPFIAE